MDTFFRSLNDSYRGLWRVWLPLALLALLAPLAVLALPLVERHLIDNVILSRQLGLLPRTLVLFVGLWLITLVFQIVGTILRTYLGERLSLRLRQRLLAQSETLSLAFSHRKHSGRTMALFLNDVPMLTNMHSTVVFSALGSVVLLVISIVLMFSLSWQLALIVAIVPPLVSGGALVVTRPLRPAMRRAQEKTAELTERIQENLAGLREIVAFGQERAQGLRFTTTLSELLRLRMRVTFMDTAFQAGQSFFSLTLTLVILGYGGYLVLHGKTTVGTLFAIRSLFSYMFQHLGQMFGLINGIQKVIAAADRVYEFLDEVPEVYENPVGREPEAVVGEVRFNDVSFAYDPGQPVLHNISFTAQPGEMIALVGPSGAGKSTLVSLIPRFYDPSEGCVLLDDVDVFEYTTAGLRRQIGIVFQNNFLFATTIRENIAFGYEGADEGQIIAAACAAHAWEFIERLPRGLDTSVGERGVHLSEGQKQRIAIARALLRDPRILILDEPTSALDARSEHLLQLALDNLMRGRTTFVIAHRLATVQRADRILVLDGGCIVEQGTHAELLQRQGLYRELFDLQFSTSQPGQRLPELTLGAPVPVATT